jgi:serine/threonine protein kinase
VFLAMEYVPLGDLEKNVSENSGKIPEVEAQDITEQILSGLKLMHAESFAHRDLKPQVFYHDGGRFSASNANIIIF